MHQVLKDEVVKPLQEAIGRYRMISLAIVESTYFVIGSSYCVRVELANRDEVQTRELSFDHACVVFQHFLPQLKN